MVNLETCRKVLSSGGYDKEISNDEIRNLIEFLYNLEMKFRNRIRMPRLRLSSVF